MNSLKNLLLFFLVFLIFVSCATLISGTKQNIYVTSEPPGADIYVNNQNKYQKTPATITVNRRVRAGSENTRNEYLYTFKKEGYEDQKVLSSSHINPWIWGNIIITPFIWFTIPIDLISGSAIAYNNHVQGYLVKRDNTRKEIVYVPTGEAKNQYVFERLSDVDQNIPVTPNQFNDRFALIIGNEDYTTFQTDMSSEINVDFARNDASAVKEYCIKTMGVPETNIIFLLDATTGQMNQAIAKANKIIKNTAGKATFYVYYAGHGLPDEVTKEPYLIPVDVSGKNAADGIALKSLYEKLTEFPSQRLTVFIDACFSGGARNQGLLAARGVKINPKADAEAAVKGNLVVFSASSNEQSSLPLKAQQHGMFTYFLLKKLKETGGQVTYSELSDYIIENVSLQSVLVNDKEQHPKVNVSSGVDASWKAWRIK